MNEAKETEREVLSRIIDVMDEKSIKRKDLCQSLGVNPQVFTNWNNGNNQSFMKHLPNIANILGTSVDYLLGKTEVRTLDEQLDGIDFALSGEIRDLSDNEKQDLLDYIRFKKQQKGN